MRAHRSMCFRSIRTQSLAAAGFTSIRSASLSELAPATTGTNSSPFNERVATSPSRLPLRTPCDSPCMNGESLEAPRLGIRAQLERMRFARAELRDEQQSTAPGSACCSGRLICDLIRFDRRPFHAQLLAGWILHHDAIDAGDAAGLQMNRVRAPDDERFVIRGRRCPRLRLRVDELKARTIEFLETPVAVQRALESFFEARASATARCR